MALSSKRARYICDRCLLRQTRSYSTPVASKLAPPPPSGAAKLTNRRLISLHGAEVPKFLQGIITNNIKAESRTGFYAAFLNAQGRVLNDVFINPTLGSKWHTATNSSDSNEQPGYLVEVDAEEAETLFRHLKRHKLRSKFKLRLLDEQELNVWSVWDETDRWTAHTQSRPSEGETGRISLIDARAPGLGQRWLLPSASSGNGLTADVDEAPLTAYTIRRYLRGVPEGQKEIPREEALPMNYNIDVMGGIDFRKGCYVGQELTIRTHHTGVVRKRILPVQLYDCSQEIPTRLDFSVQGLVKYENIEGGVNMLKSDGRRRPAGKLVAHTGNIGLGLCRLDQMTDLPVSSEATSFDANARFVVQTNSSADIGVKAFVPDWMRGRIRSPKAQKRVE